MDNGHEQLWETFGLSRASFLVMPRAFMHAMPDAWQEQMAALIREWEQTWDWPEEIGIPFVSNKVGGRFAAFPRYVVEYRHPMKDAIDSCRTKGDQ